MYYLSNVTVGSSWIRNQMCLHIHKPKAKMECQDIEHTQIYPHTFWKSLLQYLTYHKNQLFHFHYSNDVKKFSLLVRPVAWSEWVSEWFILSSVLYDLTCLRAIQDYHISPVQRFRTVNYFLYLAPLLGPLKQLF